MLGEQVAIGGSPHVLTYMSDRVQGRQDVYDLEVPLLAGVSPQQRGLIKRIELDIHVAGAQHRFAFEPAEAAAQPTFLFTWDGLDGYGRPAPGRQRARIELRYVYTAVYTEPTLDEEDEEAPTFARPGTPFDPAIYANRARNEVALATRQAAYLGAWDAQAHGLGGWTFSPHHVYQPDARTLTLGTGEVRAADVLGDTWHARHLDTVIGPDGDQNIVEPKYSGVQDAAALPDGSALLLDHGLLIRLSPGEEPQQISLASPGWMTTSMRLAVARDGRVFVQSKEQSLVNCQGDCPVWWGFPRIRMFEIVGAEEPILISETKMESGGVFTADVGGVLYRRRGDHDIWAYDTASGARSFFAGDHEDARIRVPLGDIVDLLATEEGLYVAVADGACAPGGTHQILRLAWHPVDPDDPANVTVVAGGAAPLGSFGQLDIGAPAADQGLCEPAHLAVDGAGRLYFGAWSPIPDALGHDFGALFAVDTDGTLRHIAGALQANLGLGALDGAEPVMNVLPYAEHLRPIGRVVFHPDGELYLVHAGRPGTVLHDRILRMSSVLPSAEAEDILVPDVSGEAVYRFDSEGRHLATLDGLTGAPIRTFEYDPSGRLTRLVEQPGAWETTLVHADGHVDVAAPDGTTTRLVLGADDEGQTLDAVQLPPVGAGPELTFEYAPGHLLSRYVDADGGEHDFEYDDLGRLVADHGPEWLADDGPRRDTTTLEREATPDGFRVVVTDPLGEVSHHGLVVAARGAPALEYETPDGLLTEDQDPTTRQRIRHLPSGEILKVSYTPHPRFGWAVPLVAHKQVLQPDGIGWFIFNRKYDRQTTLADPHDPFSATASTLTVESWTGAAPRRTRVTTATRDAADGTWLFTSVSPEGRVERGLFDDLRQPLWAESGVLVDQGQGETFVSDGIGRVEWEWTEGGRLASVRQDGRETTYDYAGDHGPVARVTNGRVGYRFGHALDMTYDARGEVVGLDSVGVDRFDGVDTLLSSTSLGRSPGGLVTSLAGPNGPAATHVLDYDARGLEVAWTAPGAQAEETVYGPGGVATELQLAGQAEVTVDYDERWRIASTTWAVDDAPDEQATRAYDDEGRLVTVEGPGAAVVLFEYDDALPVAQALSLDGVEVGRITLSHDPGMELATSAVTLEVGPAPPLVVELEHDDDGLPTRVGALELLRTAPVEGGPTAPMVTGTRLSAGDGSVVERVERDSRGMLEWHGASLDEFEAYAGDEYGGEWPFVRSYTGRDIGFRLTQVHEWVGVANAPQSFTYRSLSYEYDLAGRLTLEEASAAEPVEYAYDLNGNRTLRAQGLLEEWAEYDAQDRLLSVDHVVFEDGAAGERVEVDRTTTTYGYNPRGQVVSRDGPDGLTTYRYDARGALRAVETPDGVDVTYRVDGLGRRVQRVADGGGHVTTYLYDAVAPSPVAVIEQVDGETEVSLFVYATRSHVPDYMVRDGVVYRLLADQVGSVRVVIDVAAGEVVQRLDYDAYGRMTGDGTWQPFGFAGGIHDPVTGLVSFQERDYDPRTGRWTSKDPIGFGGGDANLYAYVGNDPVNRFDPTGLAWEEDVSSFFANFGDTITLGATKKLRKWLGQDDLVDYCSDAFKAGGYAGMGADLLIGGGAGKALVRGFRARRAAKTSCRNGKCPCFVAGTSVATGRGAVAIEQVALGDWVEPADPACDALDISSWQRAVVEMRMDGDRFTIELLRPHAWFRELGVVAGAGVLLELDELGVRGLAYVHAVDAPSLPERRPGCPVTGTIAHASGEILHVATDPVEASLEITAHHRVWSATRGGFVAASELRVGERLATRTGEVTVTSVTASPTTAPVFNLEVSEGHRYYVGAGEILVHNSYASPWSDEKRALVAMAKRDKKRGGITRADMDAYKELNKSLPDPFPSSKVRGPERHPDRNYTDWHGHVGPVDHIPIKDM